MTMQFSLVCLAVLFANVQGTATSRAGGTMAMNERQHLTQENASFVRRRNLQSSLTWAQVGSTIVGETGGDESGGSVSFSDDGTRVAIGARNNDGVNGADSGHVRIYELDSATGEWIQLGGDIDGEASGDFSGWSVSMAGSGDIVAVGANGNDGAGVNAGHVRVYQYADDAWTQLGDDIDGDAEGGFSGISVSMSGDGSMFAIGADGNDNDGSEESGTFDGKVTVYRFSDGEWTQVGSTIDDGEAPGSGSGQSVSLSTDGTRLALSASNSNGNGSRSGFVSVYELTDGDWVQLGANIDGESAFDFSGISTSLSGDGSYVAIGAPDNEGENGPMSGHVRVFRYLGNQWVQIGSDIDGESEDDRSGFSVSLSEDGFTVAIGAFSNDGNGVNAGHVRVFQNIDGEWVQLGADFDGETADDQSGWSVSLSSDGKTVAIGSIGGDGNGSSSGEVQVYTLPSTPVPTAAPSMATMPTSAPQVDLQDTPTMSPSLTSVGDEPVVPSSCFSSESTVHVQDKAEPVKMQDLRVGDKVLNGKNVYEPVFAFGHLETAKAANFLQIKTMDDDNALEITEEHLVYVKDKSAPVRADSVKVGDSLIRWSSTQATTFAEAVVTSITMISRNGVYAPLTADGTIVVDDILASTYAGVQSNGANAFVEIGNTPLPFLSQATMIHIGLSPLRFVCTRVSSNKYCHSSYSEKGVHSYAASGMSLIRWGETQNGVVQCLALVVCLLLAGGFMALECVCSSVLGGVLLTIAVVAYKALVQKKRMQSHTEGKKLN